MIVLSITTALDPRIEDEWVSFFKEVHIPSIMNKGMFVDFRFSKLRPVEGVDLSYNLQLRCEKQDHLDEFLSKHYQQFQINEKKRFEGRYASFLTVLDELLNG